MPSGRIQWLHAAAAAGRQVLARTPVNCFSLLLSTQPAVRRHWALLLPQWPPAVGTAGYDRTGGQDHDVALLLLDKPATCPTVKLAPSWCCPGCKRNTTGCCKPLRVPVTGDWLPAIGFGRLDNEGGVVVVVGVRGGGVGWWGGNSQAFKVECYCCITGSAALSVPPPCAPRLLLALLLQVWNITNPAQAPPSCRRCGGSQQLLAGQSGGAVCGTAAGRAVLGQRA
mgnify:CR=1 FL=1